MPRDQVQNGTLTNIFWGLFLIWFGVVAVYLQGDLVATINSALFAIGTGALLLLLNLVRSSMRLKLSMLTIGLGAILTIANAFVLLFDRPIPFLPELLIIAGAALVIGAFRTRNFQTY
ncbi:MAG: hypothetical protein KGI38_10580 [Thaumarchaeota archaeon]|nr:hypothetical protein [Nitrososphaerota archaeon]